MSMAEKLTTIAENTPRVYNQGYEDGKNSVVDYLPFAKTVQFNSLNDFGKAEVVLNLDNLTSLFNFCNVTSQENQNTTVEHLTINNAKPLTMANAFNCAYTYRDNTLKHLTLNFSTAQVTSFQNAFSCLSGLEIIGGQPLDLSSASGTYALSNIFNYHDSLKEVRFIANSIPLSISFSYCLLLSDTSIQSIIDGLADLSGGTAQTLTLHATVGAKLTDTQKATITAKNWTLVY